MAPIACYRSHRGGGSVSSHGVQKISSQRSSPQTGIIDDMVTLATSIIRTRVTPTPSRSPTWKLMKKTVKLNAVRAAEGSLRKWVVSRPEHARARMQMAMS